MRCPYDFRDATLTIAEPLTEEQCAAIAAGVTEMPSCAGLDAATCPENCAGSLLNAADRCKDYPDAFPDGARQSCEAGVLARAPDALVVTASCSRHGYLRGTTSEATSGAFDLLLQPLSMNSRPHYITADAEHELVYNGASWTFRTVADSSFRTDAVLDMATMNASLPIGEYVWRATCASSSRRQDVLLTVLERDCQALATEATSSCPAQADDCPLDCAETVLPYTRRCIEHLSDVDGRAAACQLTMDNLLGTAPDVLMLTDTPSCGGHSQYQGQYLLQTDLVNGRPHYASSGGSRHLFWCYEGHLGWIFNDVVDCRARITMMFRGRSSLPPLGSSIWLTWCPDRYGWEGKSATLVEQPSEHNCRYWASTALEAGACDTTPNAMMCTIDCALEVLPIARRCESLQADLFPAGLHSACRIFSEAVLGNLPQATTLVEPMYCHDNCACDEQLCMCSHGYHAQSDLQGCTSDLHDNDCDGLVPNSRLNSDGFCICQLGFAWRDSQCVTPEICQFEADGCKLPLEHMYTHKLCILV